MDGWWREFSGYLEGLSVLYSHVKGSSGEDDKLLAKAKELAADGTRTGQQLFDPFGRQLHGLDPPDISMITETAVDLLDTILFKLFALLETS